MRPFTGILFFAGTRRRNIRERKIYAEETRGLASGLDVPSDSTWSVMFLLVAFLSGRSWKSEPTDCSPDDEVSSAGGLCPRTYSVWL